jgi:formate hydrogenlyase subunit 3/multisubunit Na+/H+ antiporter MnhD subunit
MMNVLANPSFLLVPIVLPVVLAVLTLILPRRQSGLAAGISVLGTLAQVVLGVMLFRAVAALGEGGATTFTLPWGGFGMDFMLRFDRFSAFILAAAAGFSFLVALYAAASMREHPRAGLFHAGLLLTAGFTTGAVLADNLVVMLFFWEGMLCTLFGMIVLGRPGAWRTAVKAFVLTGVADLCLMFGIGLVAHLAGTLQMSAIHLELSGLSSLAFIFLMIGATAKAGALPFHTWIPDAAVDAPLPFMAFLPAALEKLLGIYFLGRISLYLFNLTTTGWVSHVLMILGAATILVAVMMALIQKDYKRLLSYHAISQVGYMILGIGTAVPAGIVGGLFHMINHAMYKCCLFLTGGAVERQTGTTDLTRLGGIGRAMPLTFGSFIVAACAISGVPPFNGFFSKELVYDGALERGWYYYAAALLGSFLTAASFLKLGHSAFLGPRGDAVPENAEKPVRDPPWAMLVPMLVLVLGCILFGVYNALPLRSFIQPILGAKLEGHDFVGWPHSWLLVVATVVVLGLALANHWFGVKRTGRGVGAADHIHHAPGLAPIYDMAEKRAFDPYDLGLAGVRIFALVSFKVDRAIDWVYDVASVRTVQGISREVRRAHTGSYASYVLMALAGLLLVLGMLGSF